MNNKPMKCQVCETQMNLMFSDYGGCMLLERLLECPNDCYRYHYLHGNIVIGVGKFLSFELTHDSTLRDAADMAQRIKSACRAIKIANAYRHYKSTENEHYSA